jgi:hypothetical protein
VSSVVNRLMGLKPLTMSLQPHLRLSVNNWFLTQKKGAQFSYHNLGTTHGCHHSLTMASRLNNSPAGVYPSRFFHAFPSNRWQLPGYSEIRDPVPICANKRRFLWIKSDVQKIKLPRFVTHRISGPIPLRATRALCWLDQKYFQVHKLASVLAGKV